jgi:tetratricopeptide (TPR) repeat protein/TolB-like protein
MIGRTISHYRVLEKIGGGGMGVVYKAEDTKLRRTVALKFLAPELTRDEDAKRRFVHEAQAASALDHPNICSIFDIDETPEGQLYIAMACYEGETLKSRIARRKLEVREAFEIAFSVAQGLARAHANGIIHRDIKPGNVMITNDGFVKIVDFGLAKLIGRSRITGSGATLGTVAYMAPEQARSEEADERADIWSIGAVLYEMLTGRLPFRGEIDQAMVYSILNENPTPLKELRSDVPDACAAVVMKCLDKDPNRRYASALEFCAAIIETSEKVGWGGSFATGSVRAVSIVRGGRKRRRKLALPLAAAAIVLTTAGALAWRHWRTDSIYSTKIRLAVMPFERLGDTPSQAFVDGLSRCTASVVESMGRVSESMWVVPYQHVLSDHVASVDRVGVAFGVNRLLQGQIDSYGVGHRLTLSLVDAATMRPLVTRTVDFKLDHIQFLADSVDAVLQHVLGVKGTPGPSLMMALDDAISATAVVEGFGWLANWRTGTNALQARQRLLAAVPLDSVSAPGDAALGFAHYACFRKSLDESQADSSQLAAAEKWLRASLNRSFSTPEVATWLSYVYQRMGRGNQRVATLEAGTRDAPNDLLILEELGWAYADEQRYEEAEGAFEKIVRRAPDYSLGQWCLGWVYWRTGQHELELKANQRAYALAPGSYRVLNSLGLYFDAQGDLTHAREYFERAFLAEPNCATCSNVGRVLYFEGRFKDSARYYEYALDYCDTTQYVYLANLAGSLYYVDGEKARAKKTYQRAIQLATARLEAVPDDAETAAALADFYSMTDDRDQAFATIERISGTPSARATFRIAQVYEHFGQRTQALSYMDQALQREMPIYEVVNEPLMADLVKDPRFIKMLDAAKEVAAKREP